MRRPARAIRGRFRHLLLTVAVATVTVGVSVPAVGAREPTPAQSAAPNGLDVQPFPGTPDASPRTDIGFPALAPGEIKALTVTGSRSGHHRGRLSALPAGHGTAFVPFRPFTDGERVSVRATLSSRVAGTASGAPGARRIGYSFTVAVPAPSGGDPAAKLASNPAPTDQTQSFYSENWLHPPVVSVSGADPDPSQGDIFTDVENSIQEGPLILSPQGQLVWFQPLGHLRAFNVQVQSYLGQTVLTYWQGVGVRTGCDVILNHSYQQIAQACAGNGYSADAHEFLINPQGDAFITVYAPVRANLSSIGGPRHGTLMDSIIQEIDIATGQVLWEWHASGHVRLSATHAGQPGGWPFDYFHINSIQQLPNGNLLVSARYTWALYEINMRSGRIVFEVGGKHSSFRMGPGTNFEWQHDAHMQPDGTITVFDNGSNGPTQNERFSRALRIRLNFRSRRARLVAAYTSRPPQVAASQGSVQLLPDGNTFVGWGSTPYLTELSPNGTQLFRLHFSSSIESYRAYRFQWWGQPTTPPWATATPTAQGTTVYASWNGATDVAAWRVLAGPSATALTPVGQYPDSAFETAMSVPTTEPYVAVQALDVNGNVLGTSAAVGR